MQGRNNFNHRRVASDNITSLSKPKGEIFVFGSNGKGHHKNGLAAYAVEHFNARWGVGEGKTGRCYAIPTDCSLWELGQHVQVFIRYTKWHPDNIFLVTKIGCEDNNNRIGRIAWLFRPCTRLTNVYLPAEFFNYY